MPEFKNSECSSGEIKISGTRKSNKRTGSSQSACRRSKRQRAGKGRENRGGAAQGQDFDSTWFISHDAWSRYVAFSQGKERFIEEREIALGKSDPIRKLIDGMQMLTTVTNIKSFDSDVVLEFWANFPKGKSETGIKEVLVRDWMYEFSASRINNHFGLKDVDERTHKVNFAGVLDDEVASFITGGKIKEWNSVSYSMFKSEYKNLYKVCCSNWLPTTNDGYAKLARAKLIYMVAHKIPFNFGSLVYDHISQLAWSTQAKFKLPYPSLIQQLLDAQHQVTKTTVDKEHHKTEKKSSSFKNHTTVERAAIKRAMEILQEALNAGMSFSNS